MTGAALDKVAEYLAGLPAGLASFPEYQQKGSVLREFVKGLDLRPVERSLPTQLTYLVTDPPPISQWIPHAHTNAFFTALRHELFPSDQAFIDFAYERNVRLLRGPIYRVMFALANPERVVRRSSTNWSQFHQGSELVAPDAQSQTTVFRLNCPPTLMPPYLARCHATGFRAALEAAGGRNVAVDLIDTDAEGFRFSGRWD